MAKVRVRHFEGYRSDGTWCGMVLTAGWSTPPEALEIMDQLGVKALESKVPGIKNVRVVGEWLEHEIPEPEYYVRMSWRHIRPGHVIKDPLGNRVIAHADKWGYRLKPSDRYPYDTWVHSWPKVGRLKVVLS